VYVSIVVDSVLFRVGSVPLLKFPVWLGYRGLGSVSVLSYLLDKNLVLAVTPLFEEIMQF